MLKINKSLRRLGIVSVSALMLLGVGASAMGSANVPVHAESNAEIIESLRKQGASSGYVDLLTPEQKRDEARATAWANRVDRNNDIKDYESEGMTRSQAVARENGYKKQKQIEESKEAKKLSKEQQKRVAGKSAQQLAKEQKMAMVQGKKSRRVTKKHIRRHAKRHNRKAIKRNRRAEKRTAKRAIKGISASRYTRALRKSNYVLRHGRRHATRYAYRMVKKFNKANKAEKKAYRKFARKHTNRNRKAVNKAITNLNDLVNALLK